MTVRKRVAAPAEKVAIYERLLASVEGIEARSSFGSAYTAVNGNMYSMVSKYGVVGIRLPAAARPTLRRRGVPRRPRVAAG